MKKILVAVDGSDNANLALDKAKEIGLLNNSEIVILYVISCLRSCHPYAIDHVYEAEIHQVLMEQSKAILDESMKRFKDYPSKVASYIKCGDPAKEIIEKAHTEKCDLVIMGSRGLNVFSRAMLGSISNKVLNHIDISVLIVK
ncbi:MAG: universal stress protein [Tissierellaceae bacterium]